MQVTILCYLVRGNDILLVPRVQGFGAGVLNGIYGEVLPGERPEHACVREVESQIGYLIEPPSLKEVAVIDFYTSVVHLSHCHVFFAKRWEGELRLFEEMGMPEWHNMKRMPYKRMWKSDEAWMPFVLAGKKVQAKVHYQNGTFDTDQFTYEVL